MVPNHIPKIIAPVAQIIITVPCSLSPLLLIRYPKTIPITPKIKGRNSREVAVQIHPYIFNVLVLFGLFEFVVSFLVMM